MSTTIDQRVVEMRFDNKQFERETRVSMSTLDKLKNKLNLTGASKGLEEINKASKNNSLPILGSAAEAVSAKFSALEVMGITALANLTNSAVNAGKRIVESLTIAPIKDGFQEYEMTLNAVQTTMAATGKTASEVAEQLKVLDEYADKTVYSTADMLNNLPKFTNAGVELEKATTAMIGIANATALAGGDASKASIAFYNLGQAIGTGYLTRMDYNSINNAGIATMEWKNQMVEAAISLGTLNKVGEDAYEAGGKTYTLQQLFIDGLQKQWATTDVMMKVFGAYGDETTEIGKKSYAAAQDIKTFSMMMDSLKATAGTGWKETWELVFGGLDDAKEFWTGLSNFLSNIITGIADWRNNLVEKVMGNPLSKTFQGFITKLDKGSILAEPIDKATKALDNLDDIANRVIKGEFGNAPVRFEKLAEAGYNYAKVQNKVNEILGSSHRHNEDLADSEEKVTTAQNNTNKAREKTIEDLVKMSDTELKSIGVRQGEINALRALEEQSKKTGIPINELAKDLSLLNGRTLLINSFKNIGDALVNTFKSMKTAWKEIFTGDGSETIYNIIAGFHKLTTYLKVNEETAGNLTRTFKGIFAILDIITTLTMGPLKIAFKALTALLGAFDMNILDATAKIGDAIVKFRDWIDATINFNKVFEILAPYITSVGKAIGDWIDKNIDLAKCLETIEGYFGKLTDGIGKWIEGLKNTDNVPLYIMESFSSGLKKVKDFIVREVKDIGAQMFDAMCEIVLLDWSSIPGDIMKGFEKGLGWGILSIIKKIRTFCLKFIEQVKDVFVIKSPSHVMFEMGQFVIQGFLNGITSMFSMTVSAIRNFFSRTGDAITGGIDLSKPFGVVLNAIKSFGGKVVEIFKKIQFDKIAAGALGIGMLLLAKKALDIISMFANPFDALGDMFESIGNAFDALGKNLKAGAMKKRAQALLIISAAIMVLVFAILPLTELSWEQLGKAGVSLLALAGVIAALYFVLGVVGDKGGSDLKSTGKLIIMAGSIFLVAYAVKSLSKIAIDGNIETTLKLLTSIVLGMAALMLVFGKVIDADKASHMDKAGTMLVKMAAALLTITSVIKIVSGFTYEDITKGLKFIGGVGVLFFAIVLVSEVAGEHADKAGSMLLKMSFAMMIMAGVVKIAAGFSEEDLRKARSFVIGVGVLFAVMTAVSNLAGKEADKAGKMLSSMGAAMLLMVFAVKTASSMSADELKRGLIVVEALGVLCAAIVAVSKFAGQHAAKAGIMLIAISVALLLMVGITWIVSKLDQKEMWKAVGFVAALMAMFAGLIAVTKLSKSSKALNTTLIIFLVAIGLMTAAVVGLSFIDAKSLALATGALMGVMGMFALLMVATKYTKNTKHMRKSLLTLLGITAVLGLVIGVLAKLDNPESVAASGAGLALLLLGFAGAIKILNKVSINKTAMDSLYDMLVIAGALGILLMAMSFIPTSNIPSLLASSSAMSALLLGFAGAIKILNKVSINKTAIDALYDMIVVAAALGILLTAMSFIPTDNIPSLIASSIALGVLLNAFSTSLLILSKADTVKVNMTTIVTMAGVAVALGALISAMSFLPQANIPSLLASTVALGILLNAFSASLLVLSMAGVVKVNASTIATMTGVAIALGALLSAMSFLPQSNIPSLLASSVALGVLLNAFAFSIGILSMAGNVSTGAMVAMAPMIAVTAGLAVILAIMAQNMPSSNVSALIPSAISLGVMLNAFAIAIGILSLVGAAAMNAIPATAAMGVVIAELAIIIAAIGALSMIPGIELLVSNGGNFLQSIGTAIGQFIGGLVSGFAQNVLGILPAIGLALSGFMVGLIPFISVVSSIDGVALLAGMGSLTGAMLLLVGAELLAGLATLGGVGLITAGLMLNGFIVAAKPFFDYIQTLDPTKVEAAKTLADMILILTASDLLSGIKSMFGGSVDFASLGTQLADFGKAVKAFSDEVSGKIDEEAVASAARAGEMIATLQSKLYGVGGLKQALFGEKDLGDFATQLAAFGKAIVGFNNVIVENGGISEESVNSAVRAGEAIAGLQSALYGAGGLKQDIFGEKDLSLFGMQIVAFGAAMSLFSSTVAANGGVNEEAVNSAVNAGKLMASLQTEIEGAGGFKQDLFGEKDLGDFGTQIVSFGNAMLNFSRIVEGNINEEAVTAAANAGRVLAEVQAAIPEDKWLDGKISIDDFGEKIIEFGKGLVDYSDEVVNVNVESVNNSLTAAKTLVSIAKSLVGLDASGIDSFSNVKNIGSGLSSYYTSISTISFDTVTSSISSVRHLISMIRNMAGLDTSGVGSFKSAIAALATTDMSGFTNAFKDTEKFAEVGVSIVNAISNGMIYNGTLLTTTGGLLVDNLAMGITSKAISVITVMTAILNGLVQLITSKKETFRSLGVLIMSSFMLGIASQSNAVRIAVFNVVILAASGITAHYGTFYNAGAYLVQGFCNGISENTFRARAVASAMASAAASAAKAELDEHSPSRVGYEIGDFFGIGFVNGIVDTVSKAKTAGSDVANAAKTGLSNAVARIQEMVDTGIDTQPTIRPVLDLSNVESGASVLNGLFNNQASIGVLANAGTISTMMQNKNQNGANDDVIMAIDKLRNKLDSVGNTYYTIDGITYSNGTEVADAITSLTRAIKMEGRV